VPGAGLVLRKTSDPFVDLFFEFVFVDEAVDLHGAEEMADAFADAARGNFLPERKGRRERPRVGRHYYGFVPTAQ
jgi:hypothetical protein